MALRITKQISLPGTINYRMNLLAPFIERLVTKVTGKYVIVKTITPKEKGYPLIRFYLNSPPRTLERGTWVNDITKATEHNFPFAFLFCDHLNCNPDKMPNVQFTYELKNNS